MNPITRRGLLAGLGVAAAARSTAQETASAASGATMEDDLKSARDQMRANAAKLAAVKVPVATEPAFVFKTLS